MAIEQTVLFTVLPRGISIDRDPLPVSVFVSPRLMGADTLGAFPDWLAWTSRLVETDGGLTIRSEGQTVTRPIDRDVLRPELWEALFHEDTLVRSFEPDDYGERGVLSYSIRQTLSALKAVYQDAGVHLALPDTDGDRREESRNRARLRGLVDGLDVHWSADRATAWRGALRRTTRRGALAQQPLDGPLDAEGLVVAEPEADAFRQIAVPFAVFHHMPTPSRAEHPLAVDADTALDFHQALGALASYPALLRALGLVFDLELPRDAVPERPFGQCGTMAVVDTSVGWQVSTSVPPIETAYVHTAVGTQRQFFAAPRAFCEPGATVPAPVIGLLALDPARFGLAQVDVDGGMHKTMLLSETLNDPDPDRNLVPGAQTEPAPHPEVFDPEATLPALRSGGVSLYADRRGLHLLDEVRRSKAFNDAVAGALPPGPLYAEDLVRGYRLDVWDSHTEAWHSLHRRSGRTRIGDQTVEPEDEEGFVQLAMTTPAPGADGEDDLYLHEAIARWAGWSLSVPRPGKHLSRFADPDRAVPPDGDDPDFREDEPVTPFDIQTEYRLVPGSLPRLAFGRRYRLRARAVDLAGNSLELGEDIADRLSTVFALPRDPEGFAYLRYEPVEPPLLVIRDEKAVTGPGSALDRLVIRTFNATPDWDAEAADLTAADRHVVPPRTSVEMGERLGMFDDDAGTLKADAATWALIRDRDAGAFPHVEAEIAGKTDTYPLVESARLDALPHLPDLLSRGAALRDLPGTPDGSLGRVAPGAGAPETVPYDDLLDPSPRPGSATLVGFGAGGDGWQGTVGFRLALAEPEPDPADLGPRWDPAERVLTVFLPKGQTAVVPLSSYVTPDDLALMGVWQWVREYIERLSVGDPLPPSLRPGGAVDEIAHVVQRAVEGGHWMLTPPRLVTLVHAVQQPIGRPAFAALNVEHEHDPDDLNPLQTSPTAGSTDATELAPITAWRRLGATDAFLMGALHVHGASTGTVDLFATWDDPIDDVTEAAWAAVSRAAHVDTLPLPDLRERYLEASGAERRRVGRYDPEHDQIAFVRADDWTGVPDRNTNVFDATTKRVVFQAGAQPNERATVFGDAAPRHLLGDSKHHRVRYTAVAASRYQEYFPASDELTFTRESEPVVVDVPASARPLAPSVAYVIPTFGWQRQTETNLKRSVRFGGGLRVYLHRPWFSSGEGERLGVAFWSYASGSPTEANLRHFKPYVTRWGMDPIWQTGALGGVPGVSHVPDAESADYGVTLEERTAASATGEPGRIDVAGVPVAFDADRQLWYADLTLDVPTQTYMPFVRLALVRYQPHALADAKVSRVVLADFAQLTPGRAATVTADPHHPRRLRVAVSGIAPRGPRTGPPEASAYPTRTRVRVQERDPALPADLGWHDAPSVTATVASSFDHVGAQPDLALWTGTVTFAEAPEVGRFRLLIEEFEDIVADPVPVGAPVTQPERLVYAETFDLDDALVREA